MMRAAPRKRPSLAALALVVCVPLLLSSAAAADLLVTRDGTVITTQGAWKVKGKLVIFELPDGQLASLQLGSVDLEASQAATERSKTAPEEEPAAPPPPKTAVMVLTDADVRSAGRAEGDGSEPSAAAPVEGGEISPAAQRLVVSSWEDASGPDGLVITGEIANESPDVAANISLGILLYDRQGEVLQTVLADVTSQVLQPGQRARFRADVEGIFSYSALRFEAESVGLAVGTAEQSPGGDEG